MAKKTPEPESAKPDEAKLEGQFDMDSPTDWAKYWSIEFKAAREEGSEDWPGIKRFQEDGQRIVKRYRASRKGSQRLNDARINLFPANVQTQRAILVGQVPKSEVSRRYADPDDDVGRIASTILERLLNYGLEDEGKGFVKVMEQCTEDRLLPGICGARIEFCADFETTPEVPARMGPCQACRGVGMVAAPAFPGPALPTPPLGPTDMPPSAPGLIQQPVEPSPCPTCGGSGQVEVAPAIPPQEKPVNEQTEARYWNWQDQLWSEARTFDEIRWWAFGAQMSRTQLREAFGDDIGGRIPLNVGKGRGKEASTVRRETPWSRAMVWEIWSKEHRRLFWYVEGFNQVFWHVDNPDGHDPLGLDDFWPFPAPMIANATTDAFLPVADFTYAKDLYDEADELTSRIRGIVRAIKVAGVRNQADRGLTRLLDEACELELIPVANWTEFTTKGGLPTAFQLLPIADMVTTVQALVQQRNLVIENIYQVTGMGDIIRGQQQQIETATTSAIKARFASVRLQNLQREVARYATDLQRLRKEVMAKHFSIETIIERSAIMQSMDGKTPQGQQQIMAAAQLIKDRHLDFRVAIKPEQISIQDWTQLKQQRTEVLTALGGFFQSMTPLLTLAGAAGPGAMQTAKWLVAGMPGASGAESAFDAFVQQVELLAQQPPPPPQAKPPDPKIQAAQIKATGDVQKTQAATQGRIVEIAAETQANMAQRQHDAQMDVATDAAKGEAKMRLDALRTVNAVTSGLPPLGGGQ